MTNLPFAVLDHIPDSVILVDERRRIVAANRAAEELLGNPRIGQDLAMSIRHPDILSAVDSAMQGDQPRDLETTLPGTPPRSIAVHAEWLDHDPSGLGITAVIVITDITASKRSEQMRADFVANASHELRSPLSAIIGFLETLAESAKEDAEARARFIEIMLRESRRMTRLIDDLLSLSRVEINEHVRPTGYVNIEVIVNQVTETLAGKAADRGIRFKAVVPAGLPRIIGDEEQLLQVLHNLVDNAIKYANPGSRIEIEAQSVNRVPGRTSPGISIAVSDESDGIPPDVIPRLTERFFRVDEARSRQLGSTGLGLAICKHIINRHRGHLTIDSTKGKGSTFTVFLPSQPAETARAE
ncbi:MAG: ATP-binding protein [Rhodospirillales bacterium]